MPISIRRSHGSQKYWRVLLVASIIKRLVVNGTDGANMETNIRCFASKEVCDKAFGGS